MSGSINSIELKALGRRYPDLAFEDRLTRGKPIANEYMFLRFQATRNVLTEANSPAIALVAHAESVSRLADILAQRNRAQ